MTTAIDHRRAEQAAWSEREFQNELIKQAKKLGYTLIYHVTNSKRGRVISNGFPDLILLKPSDGTRPARLVVAELKAVGNEASAEQLAWLAAFRAAGVEAFLWRSVDYDEACDILARG